MKIIHTADIHLESALSSYQDKGKSKLRKNELLISFERMVQYGKDNGVAAIIIAGDLFDVRSISAKARDTVISSITDNPDITFYYLRGNHDADSFFGDVMKKYGELPSNLKLFKDEWTSYRLEGDDGTAVTITGAELDATNNSRLVSSLVLNNEDFNIVTLHGQEIETAKKKDAEIIPLREYRNKGIDYLALGHIHSPKIEELDARGKYSYSGCLEPRGFDEVGPRGFNLLTISKNASGRMQCEIEFIENAARTVYDICVDVSDCNTSSDAVKSIKAAADAAGVTDKDYLKARLSGAVQLGTDFDLSFILKEIEDDYFITELRDETTLKIDYKSYENDATLKGQFIRLVKAETDAGRLTESEAEKVMKLGIDLLLGEGEMLK